MRGYAHVVKEDTVTPRLLFVGTEMGLWISTDGGTSWAEFKGGNFPSVAVREMQVQARDSRAKTPCDGVVDLQGVGPEGPAPRMDVVSRQPPVAVMAAVHDHTLGAGLGGV